MPKFQKIANFLLSGITEHALLENLPVTLLLNTKLYVTKLSTILLY